VPNHSAFGKRNPFGASMYEAARMLGDLSPRRVYIKLTTEFCNACVGTSGRRVNHWEIIADNLSKAGWSLGWVSAIDSNGRTKSLSSSVIRFSFAMAGSVPK
jgi:hypothetical protein